jgi:D-glycero-D-manno-heptose 1,7-bisphosphate phosphatase
VDDRGGHQAALLDRDGTIITDTNYVRDPASVTLLPGAADAIRLLAQQGIPSIVCTNQSGIARGIISLEQYNAVRLRTAELLAAEGAELLDTFSCPHAPEITGPCSCRKPATGLFERAAALYRLDLSRCVFVGDKYRDVAAATQFGGRGILVTSTDATETDVFQAQAEGIALAGSLLEGVQRLLATGP